MMTFYLDRLLMIIDQSPSYSPLTKKAYRADVRHFCTHAETIDIPSLHRYITLLKQTYAPTTVARRIHALATLFDALVAERALVKNPLAHIKKPSRPLPKHRTAFSYTDARRVIETLQDDTVYAFYFLLLHTGLRFTEARQLHLMDLDLIERQLFVRHGKGQKTRYLPLHDELITVLTRYLDQQTNTDYLFVNNTGRLLDPNQTRKQLRLASQQVLNRTLRPHDLRVTFATTLYREHHADLLTVMRLLGHSDAKTTQQYILPSSEVARSSINRLTPTMHQ
ncbi:tyrosine-type recombinase/integrase [Exiguobacterium antarcticum]|uniref:Tyrosine-type recombinase/integrase n=1 Tax=Exiguobacterium antarcticum TaxID=132920 RepID=A0ABT6R620_9BACL|nr:tyrosine-type recombinase/integrase [Exiguobacterium antarcticum]MDI3236404.1 tyrosine-type recombinase/integrase [Exiguobacterium antarcticum]